MDTIRFVSSRPMVWPSIQVDDGNHATMQPCNHATVQPCKHANLEWKGGKRWFVGAKAQTDDQGGVEDGAMIERTTKACDMKKDAPIGCIT